MNEEQSHQPRRSTNKSRQVISSRFLKTPPSSPSRQINKIPSLSSVSQTPPSSPVRQFKSSAAVGRKSGSGGGGSGLLWPSSNSPIKPPKTLADHLGSNGNKGFSSVLRKQSKEINSKENHRPVTGGSSHYTGRMGLRGNTENPSSSPSSSSSSSSYSSSFVQRGFSDENPLRRNPDSFEFIQSPKVETINQRKNEASSTRRGPDRSSGRTGSPSMLVEAEGRPVSTWRHREMEILLSFGINLFKTASKKIPSSSSPPSSANLLSSSLGNDDEHVHQLRLFHGRLFQWRYANAKAESVNQKMKKQAEDDMVVAWITILRMRQSVMQKKLQIQKQNLAMKLAPILRSQLEALQSWRDIETQHTTALSATHKSLHAAVCRVPLINGARVDEELASVTLMHAADLTSSIRTVLSSFSCPADYRTVELISELARVVTKEKLAIEEFDEVYRAVIKLQAEESSLKSAIIQMSS